MRTTTRPAVNPEELRARFRQARTMPQLLAVQRDVRQAMNDTSDELDDGAGDDQAAVQALWTQLEALFKEVGDRILRTAERDEYERRQAGIPIGGNGDPQWDRRLVSFSLRKAIVGSMGPQFAGSLDWGAERETSAELAKRSERQPQGFLVPRAAFSIRAADAPPELLRMERRVISVTLPATGPGANLIAENLLADQFIDALRAQVAVRSLGARVISDLVGNIHLPRLKNTVVTGWWADNTNLPTSDEQFDQVSFSPKHAGAIAEYSRSVLLQSTPDIEQILRMDFAKVLAQAVDIAAIGGAGDGISPQGIVTDPATPNLGAAAAPSYDSMVDVTSLLAERNALDGSLGWIADAWVRSALLKLKDGYARPYGLDLLFQGYPFAFTNLATIGGANPHPIVFGAWDQLCIAEWSAIDLLTNPYGDAYQRGGVQVRAAMSIDINRRHVESFGYMSTTVTLAAAEAATAPAPPVERRR